jgi:hypothetical protein
MWQPDTGIIRIFQQKWFFFVLFDSLRGRSASVDSLRATLKTVVV